MKIDCHQCKEPLFIKKCPCGNAFILTNAHIENRQREFDDKPVEESQLSMVVVQAATPAGPRRRGRSPSPW
jgi:hypothetical protein